MSSYSAADQPQASPVKSGMRYFSTVSLAQYSSQKPWRAFNQSNRQKAGSHGPDKTNDRFINRSDDMLQGTLATISRNGKNQ
jgi:hypothetical protein